MQDKYLIVKGTAGFGDRISTLAKACELAQKTNRTLLIDWFDPGWCHDSSSGFWTYFDFHPPCACVKGDLETKEFLVLMNAETSVFPTGWTGKLISGRVVQKGSHFLIGETNAMIGDGEVLRNTASVILYWKYSAGHVLDIPKWIQIRNPKSVKVYDLAVHCRQTDACVNKKTQLTQIEKLLQDTPSIQTVYISTDNADVSVAYYKQYLPSTLTIEGSIPIRRRRPCGIHNLHASELQELGLTKKDLNEKMLEDIQICIAAKEFLPCTSWFSRFILSMRTNASAYTFDDPSQESCKPMLPQTDSLQ